MIALFATVLRFLAGGEDSSKVPSSPSMDDAPRTSPERSGESDAPTVESRTYRDQSDLARQLARLDDEIDPLHLTVVVVLDEKTRRRFHAATVQRKSRALRLAITTTFGAGPAHDFVGDLAARAHALGWLQIVCDRNCDRAVRSAIASTRANETCVVFRPS